MSDSEYARMSDDELREIYFEYDDKIFGNNWCFDREDLMHYLEITREINRREES